MYEAILIHMKARVMKGFKINSRNSHNQLQGLYSGIRYEAISKIESSNSII